MNAYAECFVRSIKHERTDRPVLFIERSLRQVISEYIESYSGERLHQGMGNQLLTDLDAFINDDGEVTGPERLEGLVRSYDRQAA